MPTPLSSVQVAILPTGSARRAQVAGLLASDGLAESDPACTEHWQLAIVDLTDPDGFDWLRTAVTQRVPTLALVSSDSPELAARAEEFGAADFLDCAGLRSELMPRVRQVLAREAAARKAEAELRQTKDFFERLINSSAEAIIAADLKGNIIIFNQGAEELCGYRAEEAIGKVNVENLYPPGVARQVMAQLRDPQSRGRLGARRQDLLTKSGARVPVTMTVSLICEGQEEIATVGIFTDLRDRMQLERKLSDFENRLEQSEKTSVIVELAGTAAHELNQPLTSVMGYADLLKRKLKEDDFAYRPVDIIYREAERMAEIVRKIGKITRYETKSYIGSAKILDLDKASSHED